MPAFHLHGADVFRRREAYDALRAANDHDGGLAANTTVLAGGSLVPAELQAAAMTVPFLAEHRLVRVDDLCTSFNAPRGTARPRRRTPRDWGGLPDMLAALPPTTLLVFFDGQIDRRNDMRDLINAAGAEVQEFPTLKRKDLAQWLRRRIRAAGLRLTSAAEHRLLAEVGSDTGSLASELAKLALYAGDGQIDEPIVASLAPRNPEAEAWDLTDAILAGRPGPALRALHALRSHGRDYSQLIRTIETQMTRIVITCEMAEAGADAAAVRSHFKMGHPYPAQKLLEQARRYSRHDADAALRRVREADAAVHRYWSDLPGGLPQDLALEVLVVDLAGAAHGAPA